MRKPGFVGIGAPFGICLAALLLFCASSGAQPPRPVAGIDEAREAAQRFGNDAAWYRGKIPFFLSSDQLLNDVYYYRWKIVRAHQRDLGERGFISTEFLDDVSWQRHPFASLNDATGFHLGEARWLRDRRFAADYIDYMMEGGNDRHFSDYMADSIYGVYLADGDQARAVRHLGVMKHIYRAWDDKYDWSKGLYWIEPLLDATEYTISSIDASGGKDGFRGGDSFRPSINAYMYANARAISRLSALAGDSPGARAYETRAQALKNRFQDSLWSSDLQHFIDRYKVNNDFVKYWDPIRGRELAGYVPLTFSLPDDTAAYAQSWKHALAPTELGGKAGLRTVEPSYQYYMKQYRYLNGAPECQWNGPAWPFQITQTLLGMANLLDHYRQTVVTRSDYLRLMRQYAELHFQDGKLDLEEDYDPDSGKPIVGLDRSHHYFHSGYIDLMVTGLTGIRPRADDMLEVNPLLPAAGEAQSLSWFRLQSLPYHGHLVSVTWDEGGARYTKGLTIEVDGKVVARRDRLERVVLPLARKAAAPIIRPVNHAMQLNRGEFPKADASSNAGAEALHKAIDGRVWFFPEMVNGWSSDNAPEQWYAVDLGRAHSLSRAELAFFADETEFAAPVSWRVQVMRDGGWQDVAASAGPAIANGVTEARFTPVTASKVRILMRNAPNRALRLVEAKLF